MGQPRRGLFPMTDDEHRLLELLAASDDCCTDPLLLAQGFTIDTLVDLVRNGLATALPERIFASGRAIEVSRVRITEAGRRALAERQG